MALLSAKFHPIEPVKNRVCDCKVDQVGRTVKQEANQMLEQKKLLDDEMRNVLRLQLNIPPLGARRVDPSGGRFKSSSERNGVS